MHVPVVSPLRKVDIERIVLQFLKKIHPQALEKPMPFPALELFETGVFKRLFGYDYEVDILPEKHEGFCDFDAQKIVISEKTYKGASEGNPRDLFTIVHEFGHAVMHGHQLRNTPTLFENRTVMMAHRKSLPSFRNPEWQSNNFAGGSMSPIHHVRELERQGATASDLSAIFNISLKVAEIRLERAAEYRSKGSYPIILR